MNFQRMVSAFWCICLLAYGMSSLSLSAVTTKSFQARIHWLGLNQIKVDTNSAQFMKICHLPQTAALEIQTFDKLSRWLCVGKTNVGVEKIRPMLEDLVHYECHLEVDFSTNSDLSASDRPTSQSIESTTRAYLAVHLPANKVEFWQTNLAAVVGEMTGITPVQANDGWLVKRSNPSEYIQLEKKGEWTIIGFGGPITELDLQLSSNSLSSSVQSPSLNDYWMEANFNFPNAKAFLSYLFPLNQSNDRNVLNNFIITRLLQNVTHVHLAAIGEPDDILTHCTVNFSKPLLETNLPQWQIPTNFFRKSLTRFAAVRGLSPWLKTLPGWQKTDLTPPTQAFFWAQSGMPFQSYLAFPQSEASNHLFQLAQRIIPAANPWLVKHGQGNLEWQTNPPELELKGAMLMEPFIKPIISGGNDYVLGGLFPLPPGPISALSPMILNPILYTPNLVFYQSELTGQVLEDDLFVNQLLRLFFQKAQLPPDSASMHWLKQVETSLKGCATSVTLTSSTKLLIKRRSTIGFSALELHLLTDWLESPNFPYGLHTFSSKIGN